MRTGSHPAGAAAPSPGRKARSRQFKRMERHCFQVLSDYRNLLRPLEAGLCPQDAGRGMAPAFVEALQKQSHVEYLLDVLLFSDIEERAALIASYGKEVRNLERRMAGLCRPNCGRP